LLEWRAPLKDPCPDIEDLAVYLEHKLSTEETARMESHFVGCRRCREVIVSVVKSESEVPDPIIPGKPTFATHKKAIKHLRLLTSPLKK
jgi:hypothetical protein